MEVDQDSPPVITHVPRNPWITALFHVCPCDILHRSAKERGGPQLPSLGQVTAGHEQWLTVQVPDFFIIHSDTFPVNTRELCSIMGNINMGCIGGDIPHSTSGLNIGCSNWEVGQASHVQLNFNGESLLSFQGYRDCHPGGMIITILSEKKVEKTHIQCTNFLGFFT